MNEKKENSIFVSIVVPAYNEEKNIKFLIENLLNLNYPKNKYEIIVVDNNSQDKTSEIIKEFQVTYLYETKQSSYAVRNKGVRKASGNILAFIDGDCIPERDWLKNAITHFFNEDVDIITGQTLLPIGRTSPKPIEIYQLIGEAEKQKDSEQKEMCAGRNMIVKKTIFEKIGYFEEKLISGGDVEWTKRATQYGFKLRYYEDVKVYHPLETFFSLCKRSVRIGYGKGQIRCLLHRPFSLSALHDNSPKNIIRRAIKIYCSSMGVFWNNYEQNKFGRKKLLTLSLLSILLTTMSFYGVLKGFLSSKLYGKFK